MYKELLAKEKKLAVIGLGYVGLPLALEMARHFSVVGFDINPSRVQLMKEGIDPSSELEPEAFEGTDILFTANAADLAEAHFYIIAVPTDIDDHKVPNLTPLMRASKTVGRVLKPGDYVVYESTVFPGCTEEDCLPVLEKYAVQKIETASGVEVRTGLLETVGSDSEELVEPVQYRQLVAGRDFKYGYSPERINPGDKKHTLTKIKKVVSGCDEESLEEIAKVYGHIIEAGVYKAESVKVAEAAKVIENTQRDLNIAFMNELSVIFDKMGISTTAVLKAAGTKWNFLRFHPGLVGGHCIGVDPYYLAYKSQKMGYTPKVILSGRSINDDMPLHVAKRIIQMLIQQNKNLSKCRVLVKGITFKENVADIRNSKVVDLIRELKDFSLNLDITDPHADAAEVAHEYGLELKPAAEGPYDCVLVSVGHQEYLDLDLDYFRKMLKPEGIIIDLKAVLPMEIRQAFHNWSL
ncbi:MAG: nucleotide sugar dehydrogenase [Bacteroidota bacterium]